MSSGAFVHFSAEWGAALWRASWQGGLAITAVWIVCRVAPRIRPDLQCWLWRLAYLKLFVALIWATPFRLPLLPAQILIPAGTGAGGDGLLAGSDLESAGNWGGIAFNPGQIMLAMLIAIWALGFSWCVWQVIREALESRNLRSRCREFDDPFLASECESLARRFGIRQVPGLLMHHGSGIPLLIGLRRASIVLPETFLDDYDQAQRRLILAHELAHVKRVDLLWAWPAQIARCVFFFHPLVWLAEHEWQQCQEMACDRQVLQLDQVSRSTYGAVLLQVVQQPRSLLPTRLAAMRVAESYSTVKRRLTAMNHSVTWSRRRMAAAASLIAIVGLIAIVPWRVVAQEPSNADREKMEIARLEAHTGLAPKLIDALQLNERQMRRIRVIHESAVRELFRTLTPKQQVQLKLQFEKAGSGLAGVNLTDEQKQKLDGMKREIEVAFKNIENDTTLTPEQKEERMRALKQSHEQSFMHILTPEQITAAKAAHDHETAKEASNLTDDQKRQMQELHEQLMARARQIEQDTKLSQEQREERLKQVKLQGAERMHQILGPEQLKHSMEHHAVDELGPYSLASLAKLPDVTLEQKQRIEAIHREAQKQFIGTLTLAQRAKLKQIHDGQ